MKDIEAMRPSGFNKKRGLRDFGRDQSNVRLISYSKANPELFDDMGIKELVAYCARVSNPANQSNLQTVDKLIRYLIANKHWSPFEMVSICLEINTTRDIARQILRHRSFSFQEFSQRYADPTEGLSFVNREARLQDLSNRQNSIDTEDILLQEQWEFMQDTVAHEAKKAYKWAIENGIAKEVARAVLPEGLMESRLYMNGTLRSWIHYIELRTANGTQKEHMEIAKACAQAIAEIYLLEEA